MSRKFKLYNTIDLKEISAVVRVLKTGVLSGFIGSWGPKFWGGPAVQRIEQYWREFLRVPYAVSVNSATSGLQAALGACGVKPGDEVVVSPYTMCASSSSPALFGAKPVFADICPKRFTLDPKNIERRITKKTSAIMVVQLFGGPADMEPIMRLARKHKLKVIEDCAQAPGAEYQKKKVGTFSDVGVFSLNCHKVIQAGEGGICVTSDPKIAFKLGLYRNHGENVVSQMNTADKKKMLGSEEFLSVGYNFRMTEMEAAVGLEQSRKLEGLNQSIIGQVALLNKLLGNYSYLQMPFVNRGDKHVYYIYPLLFNSSSVSRDEYVRFLVKRGVPAIQGYVKPLYNLDMFRGDARGGRRNCPVTEEMYGEKLFYIPMTKYDFSKADLKWIAGIFSQADRHFGDKLK